MLEETEVKPPQKDKRPSPSPKAAPETASERVAPPYYSPPSAPPPSPPPPQTAESQPEPSGGAPAPSAPPRPEKPKESPDLRRRGKSKLLALSLAAVLLFIFLGASLAWALHSGASLPLLPRPLQESFKTAVLERVAGLPFLRTTPYGRLLRSLSKMAEAQSLSFDFNLKLSSQSLKGGILPLGSDLNIRAKGDWSGSREALSGRLSLSSGDSLSAAADFLCLSEDCYFNLVKASSRISFLDLSPLLGKWYGLPSEWGEGGRPPRPYQKSKNLTLKKLEGGLRKAGLLWKVKKLEDETLFGVETIHLSLEIPPDDLKILAHEIYAAAKDSLTESFSKTNLDFWAGKKELFPHQLKLNFRANDLAFPALSGFGLAGNLQNTDVDITLGLWDFNEEKSFPAPPRFEEFNLAAVTDKIFRLPASSPPPASPSAGLEFNPSPAASPSGGVFEEGAGRRNP